MAKVTFEFDDKEERLDIDMVNNRYKLIVALSELNELYRRIYNGKIYDEESYISVKDNKVLTSKDYEEAHKNGEPISDTKSYLSIDYIERELDNALDSVRHLLDY